MLVVGATGQVGGAAVAELVKLRASVRALVRSNDNDPGSKCASSRFPNGDPTPLTDARSVNLTEDVPLVAGTSYLVSATVEVLVAEVAEGFQDQVRAVRLSPPP